MEGNLVDHSIFRESVHVWATCSQRARFAPYVIRYWLDGYGGRRTRALDPYRSQSIAKTSGTVAETSRLAVTITHSNGLDAKHYFVDWTDTLTR